MNISAKFQLHLLYGFGEVDFSIFFRKCSLSGAITTNQIQWFMAKIHMFGSWLLKEYF